MKKSIILSAAFFLTIAAFGQTKASVEGRIWKPKSFCEIPDKVNVHGAVNYSIAFIRGISCEELDKQNLVGVWVTFQGKCVAELNMKSRFENISLIRKKTGEIAHPVAYMERSKPIGQEGNPEYASNESTFEKCTFELIPHKKYDLFILFKAAEVGDKLVIEDFLEVVIK